MKAILNFLAGHIGLLALLLSGPAIANNPSEPGANSTDVNCGFNPSLSCSDHSGIRLWTNNRFSDPDSFTIKDDRLYISQSTTSTSLDLLSGKTVWQLSTSNQSHYFFPLLADEHLYLARTDGTLEKYHARTAQLQWSRTLAGGWVYPPLMIEDKLITGGQGRTLWIIDPDSGTTLDSLALDQELVAPLFQAGALLIASTFDNQLQAFQLNPDTGRLHKVWGNRLTAPAFSHLQKGDNIVVADMGGQLSSIDVRTGKISWQQQIHSNALYWNTLFAQSLISLTDSGVLSILDLHTGRLQNVLQLQGQYDQAPIVRGKTIAVYDQSGVLQQLSSDELYAYPESPISMTN